MPYLWTPKLRKDFHEALETLYAETRTPSAEALYCESLSEADSKNYTLRLRDELQLANHIAFLAHSQEGAGAISGACVEEVRDGLIIRLASNQTPSKDTVSKVRDILNNLSRGATQGTSRTTLQESIFGAVLNLSQERILQRIRPRWIPTPPWFDEAEEPLLNRIIQFYHPFKSRSGWTPGLISRLDKLLLSLRLLETPERPDERSVQATVEDIVRRCADVSYNGKHRSLEQQLREISVGQKISESREVAQIDKLARYLGLSKDLAKLAQRSKYRHVNQNVILEYLTAYPGSRPAGALRTCYIHAEVQLILHYEQQSLQKPPRAIGCSKSACFLCDSLIQMLGQYHISYAHRRLYNQWTIPDVPWMATERVSCFRSILENMIAKMVSLTGNVGKPTAKSQRQVFRPLGLESRAGLPLSSNSDFGASTVSSRLASPMPVSHVSSPLSLQDIENVAKVPSVHSIKVGSTTGSVDLRLHDLPHEQSLSSNMGPLYLRLDGLFLIFDCSSVSAGKISIREVEEGACGKEQGLQCIMVSDITTAGMTLNATNSSTLRFWLRITRSIAIEIEIFWVISVQRNN